LVDKNSHYNVIHLHFAIFSVSANLLLLGWLKL